MTGLIPIAHGSIKIYGEDPEKAKKKIGYIPQKNLINWNFPLTVRQVVEMGLTNRNTLNPFSKKNISIIEESIKQVGVKDQIDKIDHAHQNHMIQTRKLIRNHLSYYHLYSH